MNRSEIIEIACREAMTYQEMIDIVSCYEGEAPFAHKGWCQGQCGCKDRINKAIMCARAYGLNVKEEGRANGSAP